MRLKLQSQDEPIMEVRNQSLQNLIAFLKGKDNSQPALRRAMIAGSAFSSWSRTYGADIHAQALFIGAARDVAETKKQLRQYCRVAGIELPALKEKESIGGEKIT